MDKKISSVLVTQAQEFVISRTFDVPRELMFRVWTDPGHMQHWWGPKGFTVVYQRMDLRPGGLYHYCIRSAGGQDMWGRFVFREIVKPERLVFVNSFADEKGNVARHPMHLAWPLEMLSTITFTEQAGRTTVTVRWLSLMRRRRSARPSRPGSNPCSRVGAEPLNSSAHTWRRSRKPEVHITRTVDARRELVLTCGWTASRAPAMQAAHITNLIASGCV